MDLVTAATAVSMTLTVRVPGDEQHIVCITDYMDSIRNRGLQDWVKVQIP